MGGTIKGPSGPQVQAPATINAVPAESSTPSAAPESVQSQQIPFGEKADQASKAIATHKKGEQNITGAMRQKDINQKLQAQKARTTDFPANAGNGQLKQINVHRQHTDAQTTTGYPNGVQVKTISTNTVYPNDLASESGGSARFQKKGSQVATEIVAPPGGIVIMNKDGSAIIKDAKRKEIAKMDADGKIQIHTRHGDYNQNPDGKIQFTTKEKTNPESLRKPGPIAPADYENYGIASDGKTMRFPNGVEYTKGEGFRVPNDIGRSWREIDSMHGRSVKPDDNFQASGHDKWELVEGQQKQGRVFVEGGIFEVASDGQVSFVPDHR